MCQLNVPGRLLLDSHYTQLQKVMDKAYGQSAGQKVMAALEQVKTSLQVRSTMYGVQSTKCEVQSTNLLKMSCATL